MNELWSPDGVGIRRLDAFPFFLTGFRFFWKPHCFELSLVRVVVNLTSFVLKLVSVRTKLISFVVKLVSFIPTLIKSVTKLVSVRSSLVSVGSSLVEDVTKLVDVEMKLVEDVTKLVNVVAKLVRGEALWRCCRSHHNSGKPFSTKRLMWQPAAPVSSVSAMGREAMNA